MYVQGLGIRGLLVYAFGLGTDRCQDKVNRWRWIRIRPLPNGQHEGAEEAVRGRGIPRELHLND